MITEAVLNFFASVSGFALDLIPDALGVPVFVHAIVAAMLGIFTAAATLSVWVPIPVVMAAASFRIAVLLGALGVKSLRVLLSLLTGGGGSAA